MRHDGNDMDLDHFEERLAKIARDYAVDPERLRVALFAARHALDFGAAEYHYSGVDANRLKTLGNALETARKRLETIINDPE